MIYIGIDAGKKTGVAVSFKGKITNVFTLNFWSAYDYVVDMHFKIKDIVVVIEDPNFIKPIYGKKAKNYSKVLSKIAQNVGGVKKESQLLADRFKDLGFQVIRTKPKDTKLDAEYVRKISGYKGRTNEHVRDAIMLVVGK